MQIEPHRAVAATVELPGWPPLWAVPAYLATGIGMNFAIMANIGKASAEFSGRRLLARDWNCEPGVMNEAMFPDFARLRVATLELARAFQLRRSASSTTS